MWTKVVGLGVATVLAIKSSTPPNAPPKDPAAGKVVSEGALAAFLVKWGQHLAALLYVVAYCTYVNAMWQLAHNAVMMQSMQTEASSFTRWYPSDVIALAMVVAGALLRVWCYRTLARHFTFSLTILRNHELVQSGPYALLLHPSYTGAVLVQAGYLALLVWDRLWWLQPWPLSLLRFDVTCAVLALLTAAAFYRRVSVEEAALHRHFGKRWEAHTATRKRFIPFIF